MQLAGGDKLEPPKNGAQFHFSLPGSQQGFRPQEGPTLSKLATVGNAEFGTSRALTVGYTALGHRHWAAVTTPTFSPRETLNMRPYDLMATPLVYPGQTVKARVVAPADNHDLFSKRFAPSLCISQNRGEGLISHGTRQWTDYEVRADVVVHLGNYAGVALRVQGLRRYYGVHVTREGKLQIVRVRDDETKVLVETPFAWQYGESLSFAVRVRQNTILASVGGTTISAEDFGDLALRDGGIGLFIHEGTLSAPAVTIVG
ncbi:MAG: hypothetical protein ABIY37_17495 [Devosia sp.]